MHRFIYKIPVGLILSLATFLGVAMASQEVKLLAPDFEVTSQVKGDHLVLKALPPAHHHFNVKAPIKLITSDFAGNKPALAPKSTKENLILFEIPTAATDLKILVYVCDDKNTYCEAHNVGFHWDQKTLTKSTSSQVSFGGSATQA